MPLMLGNICLFYDGTIHIASDTLSSTTVQALNIILQVILLIFYGYMIILLMRRGYYLIDTFLNETHTNEEIDIPDNTEKISETKL